MMFSNQNSGQLTAIAWLRWRLFVNTLRTARGQWELLSRILVSFAFTILGLGGAFAYGRIRLFLPYARQAPTAGCAVVGHFFLLAIFPDHVDCLHQQSGLLRLAAFPAPLLLVLLSAARLRCLRSSQRYRGVMDGWSSGWRQLCESRIAAMDACWYCWHSPHSISS